MIEKVKTVLVVEDLVANGVTMGWFQQINEFEMSKIQYEIHLKKLSDDWKRPGFLKRHIKDFETAGEASLKVYLNGKLVTQYP